MINDCSYSLKSIDIFNMGEILKAIRKVTT